MNIRIRLGVSAAFLALAGAASAQSTVTVFGIVDLGVQRLKSGSTSRTAESPDGLTSSRLGFRGTEDLGGGMSASFWKARSRPTTARPPASTSAAAPR